MEKYRKIIIVFIFILVIFILGYLLYALFFKAPPPVVEEPIPDIITGPGRLPVAETGPIQVISPDDGRKLPGEEIEGISKASPKAQGGLTQTTALNKLPSAGVTLSNNGSDLQFYNRADGKFYKVTKDGEVNQLTDKIFYDVSSIKWSPNKNKAILEYPDGANIVYDFMTDKQVTLPKHWKDFDFSPSGSQIVMKSIGLDPSNRWLAVSNVDGSKIMAIEPLGEKDATVFPSWSPNNQTIAMYTEGIDFDRQEVFFTGLNKENFKSTIVEGRDFRPLWSPQGDRLLYSVYSSKNDLKPMLWLVNAQGESIGSGRTSLGIETWADKCVFANSRDLYCAVPKNLEEGAGLFPELAQNTTDELYQIDTRTGLKKRVATPDGDYNMSNLIISDNGYYLYFTDESSQGIYKIQLR